MSRYDTVYKDSHTVLDGMMMSGTNGCNLEDLQFHPRGEDGTRNLLSFLCINSALVVNGMVLFVIQVVLKFLCPQPVKVDTTSSSGDGANSGGREGCPTVDGEGATSASKQGDGDRFTSSVTDDDVGIVNDSIGNDSTLANALEKGGIDGGSRAADGKVAGRENHIGSDISRERWKLFASEKQRRDCALQGKDEASVISRLQVTVCQLHGA